MTTLLDVRIATAKQRAEAAAVDTSVGFAGVELTRREPVELAANSKQARLLSEVLQHVPLERRREFEDEVRSRLSGCPSFGAVRAAILITAKKNGVLSQEQMIDLGLLANGPFETERHKNGGSKAANLGAIF